MSTAQTTPSSSGVVDPEGRAELAHLLLSGIAFEIVFAAAIIWLPPLQSVFHTTGLPFTDVLVLAAMAPIVWGVDELRRWPIRRSVSMPPSGRRTVSP